LSRVLSKMICEPSGDHDGRMSQPGELVSRTGFEPSAFIT
jgi:hypothetical protein